MNHQPFRDWLLSEEKLSADQTLALRGHLDACETCRQIESAWMEVEAEFRKIPDVVPLPGFSERWQTNLDSYQLRLQRRKGWITISLVGLIVAALFALITTQVWLFVQSPGSYVTSWFEQLIGLIPLYYSLQNIISRVSISIPIATFLLMFFLAGIISFMSVLWLTAYRKLITARRTT